MSEIDEMKVLMAESIEAAGHEAETNLMKTQAENRKADELAQQTAAIKVQTEAVKAQTESNVRLVQTLRKQIIIVGGAAETWEERIIPAIESIKNELRFNRETNAVLINTVISQLGSTDEAERLRDQLNKLAMEVAGKDVQVTQQAQGGTALSAGQDLSTQDIAGGDISKDG